MDERKAGPPAGPPSGGDSEAPAPAVQRLAATVLGRVQGVGYRWFVVDQASSLGLCGWVANRADGAVECVAEGSRPALERLLVALTVGPLSADVTRVIPAWGPGTGTFRSFEIRSQGHRGD